MAGDFTTSPSSAASSASEQSGPPVRALTDRHTALASAANAILDRQDDTAIDVVAWVDGFREQRARAMLEDIDVARLGEMTERNLRLSALQAAGFLTAADLLGVGASELDALPGVGAATARGVVAAVAQLVETSAALEPLRIEVRREGLPRPEGAEVLLALLHRAMRLRDAVDPHRDELERYSRAVSDSLPAARRARWRARMWIARPASRRETAAALDVLRAWEHPELSATIATLTDEIERPDPVLPELIADFERRSAEYYTALSSLAPQAEMALAARGLLPQGLVDEVNARELDLSAMRLALRGYQEFGARFALTQERVLLGDEMGLGKTIQALAVMSDLAARGHDRFLVVCPASLLSNWEREIEHRTTLRPRRMHGVGRDAQIAAWRSSGGVGLTTYEMLQQIAPDETASGVALLVVDEAHYVKNPKTLRAQAVAGWAATVPWALFMTGTPMSNRIDDFLELVRVLQPGLIDELPSHLGLVDTEAFRTIVAPVYLRRNQQDVLVELPDIVASDDWIELTSRDERAYREAVATGNLMAMRQAAWVSDDSAKLARLIEIVDEARYEARGTVIFSYFRDVLDRVADALRARGRSRVVGPLTGDVPVPERQSMVDAFSDDVDGAVLLAQITVGGTGLNLQAASVVVLCEPQLTPAAEEQAIARLHRMGQVRAVSAHRLLAEGGVDERIVELLVDKQSIFDDYVRTSSVTGMTEAAIDVTSSSLAQDLVTWEQARLGYGTVWEALDESES